MPPIQALVGSVSTYLENYTSTSTHGVLITSVWSILAGGEACQPAALGERGETVFRVSTHRRLVEERPNQWVSNIRSLRLLLRLYRRGGLS